MIRRPPRSTLDRSSAASDVYKRQHYNIQSIFAEERSLNAYGNAWYSDTLSRSFELNAFSNKSAKIIPLYAVVPNNKPVIDKEYSTFRDNVTRIAKVSNPTLTVFKPDKPNGKAVIICPGGSYA